MSYDAEETCLYKKKVLLQIIIRQCCTCWIFFLVSYDIYFSFINDGFNFYTNKDGRNFCKNDDNI